MYAKTIVVGNMKGGTGKSSVTVAFANYLAFEKEKNVLVIDADPFQQTIADKQQLSLANGADPEKLYKVLTAEPGDIFQMVDEFSEEYDFIFIDLAGTIALDGMLNVLLLADHFFVPTNFSYDDLKPTAKYLDILINTIVPTREEKGFATTVHGIGYMVMPEGVAHKEFQEQQKQGAIPVPFFDTVVPFSEVFQRKNDTSFLNNYGTKHFNIRSFYKEFENIVL